MPKVSRAIVTVAFAALAAVGAGLPADGAHRTAPRSASLYDGTWNVLIQTTRGDCMPVVRAGVRILGGQVLAENQSYQVDGRVTPSGAVRLTVSASGEGAAGSGRLSRNAGWGQWQTRSSKCAGQWTAARRE